MKISAKNLSHYALFAALTSILSQISIPLPFTPISINLALLSVFVAGGVLGKFGGMISQIVYIALGAIGLPVFNNFSGGLGVLLGLTGGYIAGYIITAYIIGFLTEKFENTISLNILSITTGLILCYLTGSLWFVFLTKTSFVQALMQCVFPFIIGDIIKGVIAAFLIKTFKNKLFRY